MANEEVKEEATEETPDIASQQMTALEESQQSQAEADSGEDAVKVEETSYLAEDDLGKHHKFKADGQELDMPMNEIIELAQKGKLYDRKQHELAELEDQYGELAEWAEKQEEIPAQSTQQTAQQAAPSGDGYFNRIYDYVMDRAKNEELNLNSPELVIAAENAKQIQQLSEDISTVASFLQGYETDTENKAKDDLLADQFETLDTKYSIDNENELINIYSEAINQGWPTDKIVQYYEWANRDKLVRAEKEKAVADTAEAERKAQAASVRASSNKRSSATPPKANVKEMDAVQRFNAQLEALQARGL